MNARVLRYRSKVKFLLLFLLLCSRPICAANSGDAQEKNNLSSFDTYFSKYHGEKKLSDGQTENLIKWYNEKKSGVDCKECSNHFLATKAKFEDEWRIVFLTRIGVRNNGANTEVISPEESGISRFSEDYSSINTLIANNKLSKEKLDQIFQDSGKALSNNPRAAMTYVAQLGAMLVTKYGDSYAGKFVPRDEQVKAIFQGGSAGQCSDIHFSMLKAYKQLVGKNAKAYLVNFQTAGKLHHTNLVIEHDNKINIINYGTIYQNDINSTDKLAQNSNEFSSHGLAYRIFTEDGEIDSMKAHIDSPLGKILRESATGQASANPFEVNNSSIISTLIEKNDSTFVRMFFAELGQGEAVMGVAVNTKKITAMPKGFSLERYIGSSLDYVHKKIKNNLSDGHIHSVVLYINTGLGVIAPELKLKNVTFNLRSDLIFEGGGWVKVFSGRTPAPLEADLNFINRTRATTRVAVSKKLTIAHDVELDLMPAFKTAFPRKADGSSYTAGLWETMGIIPNRLNNTFRMSYSISDNKKVFGQLTHQYHPLGSVGEVRAGLTKNESQVSLYLRGAFDRTSTPVFLPGAERTLGVSASLCPNLGVTTLLDFCLGGHFQKSLENKNFDVTFFAEIKTTRTHERDKKRDEKPQELN